jgi:hypothetical protein
VLRTSRSENAPAHDQLDQVLETIGSAIDQADAEANRQPREQRPAIH